MTAPVGAAASCLACGVPLTCPSCLAAKAGHAAQAKRTKEERSAAARHAVNERWKNVRLNRAIKQAVRKGGEA